MSDEIINHQNSRGTIQEFTVHDSPQQNGVAERFNQTVVEMTRTILHNASLPDTYWAEAINTTTYIRN